MGRGGFCFAGDPQFCYFETVCSVRRPTLVVLCCVYQVYNSIDEMSQQQHQLVVLAEATAIPRYIRQGFCRG